MAAAQRRTNSGMLGDPSETHTSSRKRSSDIGARRKLEAKILCLLTRFNSNSLEKKCLQILTKLEIALGKYKTLDKQPNIARRTKWYAFAEDTGPLRRALRNALQTPCSSIAISLVPTHPWKEPCRNPQKTSPFHRGHFGILHENKPLLIHIIIAGAEL